MSVQPGVIFPRVPKGNVKLNDESVSIGKSWI